MAKRYTDTDKWKKRFFRELPAEYRLFWLYLLDDCDHAGIWNVDFEVAEIKLGIKLSDQKARGLLQERVVVFDSGHKWFIRDFIEFQYGSLDPKNKMYKPVMAILEKHKLMGHLSPINGGKEKDKEQVQDKEQVPLQNPEDNPPYPRIMPGLSIANQNYPARETVQEFFVRQGKGIDEADKFYNYYEALGWKIGVSPIYSWSSLASNWIAKPPLNTRPPSEDEATKRIKEKMQQNDGKH